MSLFFESCNVSNYFSARALFCSLLFSFVLFCSLLFSFVLFVLFVLFVRSVLFVLFCSLRSLFSSFSSFFVLFVLFVLCSLCSLLFSLFLADQWVTLSITTTKRTWQELQVDHGWYFSFGPFNGLRGGQNLTPLMDKIELGRTALKKLNHVQNPRSPAELPTFVPGYGSGQHGRRTNRTAVFTNTTEGKQRYYLLQQVDGRSLDRSFGKIGKTLRKARRLSRWTELQCNDEWRKEVAKRARRGYTMISESETTITSSSDAMSEEESEEEWDECSESENEFDDDANDDA